MRMVHVVVTIGDMIKYMDDNYFSMVTDSDNMIMTTSAMATINTTTNTRMVEITKTTTSTSSDQNVDANKHDHDGLINIRFFSMASQ